MQNLWRAVSPPHPNLLPHGEKGCLDLLSPWGTGQNPNRSIPTREKGCLNLLSPWGEDQGLPSNVSIGGEGGNGMRHFRRDTALTSRGLHNSCQKFGFRGRTAELDRLIDDDHGDCPDIVPVGQMEKLGRFDPIRPDQITFNCHFVGHDHGRGAEGSRGGDEDLNVSGPGQ